MVSLCPFRINSMAKFKEGAMFNSGQSCCAVEVSIGVIKIRSIY